MLLRWFYVDEAKPHVVCITEQWFIEKEIESVNLHNYVLANSFCRSALKGGGGAIYVVNGLI